MKNKLQLYFQSKKKSSGGDCRVEAEDGAPRAAVYFTSEEDSVRLVNGTSLCSGRLEVKSNQSNQRWSSVCEADFDQQDAEVVCRELGCGAPSVLQGALYGEVEAPMWTKEFQCGGHESALLDCRSSRSARNTCSPGKAVGLTCSEPVRLVGGASRCAGTLELKHQGDWRPVIDSIWNMRTAAVACRELDCGSAVSVGQRKESSDRPAWWIRFDCVQSGSALRECVISASSSSILDLTCSAVMYVSGSYFAVDLVYYAKENMPMYLDRVLAGVFTQGRAGMITPPAKSSSSAADLDTSIHGARVKRSSSRVDVYQNLQQCEEGLTSCDTQREQIPQRAVDHSSQYDHQQILIMQDEPTVRKAATSLYEKHPAGTSVYALDQNQRPKLIHGASVPLSEDSRLTLVGHGERDGSGETRLAGYTAQDVAKIIQRTFRTGDKIKTTSVVACEVGSDKEFVETLLRELHETANIETELHLRSAVLQVRHTGDIITQEISKEGLRWRHDDDSKKVVATLDRNGDVIIRTEPGRRGEVVFTDERNFLVGKGLSRFLMYRNSWPKQPHRFINQNVFPDEKQKRKALDELEALSWAVFYKELPRPEKINPGNLDLKEDYLVGEKDDKDKIRWLKKDELKDVLSKCYEIKSGEDARRIIRHYAKDGEDEPTYLMVKDWIYVVNPVNLYVYPVGKKLDNNEIGNEDKINQVKECIKEQIGKEKYPDMRKQILNKKIIDIKERYAQYVKDIFRGEHTTHLSLSTEALFTTYFTASVIAESARNFRTFPLILMALDMTESKDNNIKEKGLKFLFEEHSMARGKSWIDPSRRGFSGSATPEGSSKLENREPSTKDELMSDLIKVLTEEVKLYLSWIQMDGNDIDTRVLQLAKKYKMTDLDSFKDDYKAFKTEINKPGDLKHP